MEQMIRLSDFQKLWYYRSICGEIAEGNLTPHSAITIKRLGELIEFLKPKDCNTILSDLFEAVKKEENE